MLYQQTFKGAFAMKKVNFYLSLCSMMGAIFFSLEAASNDQLNTKITVVSSSNKSDANQTATQEKFDIMARDQNEDSNTLAIPFDESEIEDEEQINFDEKKDVFPLPHTR